MLVLFWRGDYYRCVVPWCHYRRLSSPPRGSSSSLGNHLPRPYSVCTAWKPPIGAHYGRLHVFSWWEVQVYCCMFVLSAIPMPALYFRGIFEAPTHFFGGNPTFLSARPFSAGSGHIFHCCAERCPHLEAHTALPLFVCWGMSFPFVESHRLLHCLPRLPVFACRAVCTVPAMSPDRSTSRPQPPSSAELVISACISTMLYPGWVSLMLQTSSCPTSVWVFALSTSMSFPSSAVLFGVAWSCSSTDVVE